MILLKMFSRHKPCHAKTVACAKKLAELRKTEIKDGKAKKHQYVAMKDR